LSLEIDYEIAQYEAYSETARWLVRMGVAREARLFEAVAEICYQKATVLRKLVAMIEQNYSWNASLQLYPGFMQQDPMPACDDIDYEVQRYDGYSTYAYAFREMHLMDEAKMFTSMADLCYEKASMLSRVQDLIETGKRRDPSP
jgi:hypothetical protein